MDAAPQTGYIIRSRGLGAGGDARLGRRRRHQRGGAAHGRDHGRCERGRRASNLGFANPFIYQDAGRATSHDITQGSNANGTGGNFPADRRIRHGDGPRIGQGEQRSPPRSAPTRASPITFEATKLTGTHPLNMKRVKKGKVVDFTGRLTNTHTPGPIANRQIIRDRERQHHRRRPHRLERRVGHPFRVKKRMSWHAVFMGSGVEKPSQSPTRTVRIQH